MQRQGLGASRKVLDALVYPAGPLISRVRCGGTVLEDDDKLYCTKREHLWVLDATRVMHEFALETAADALEKTREADCQAHQQLLQTLEAKRRWLAGDVTDEELTAAREAALVAAHATTQRWRFSARCAARDAAIVHACVSAHFTAVSSAGWPSSGFSASYLRLNARLEEMLEAEHAKAGDETMVTERSGAQ